MIELVNVEKTYHTSSGDIHALKRTSLTINQGEIFGIIGLSGAGKSTLIRCINMLEVPTAGQVFVDGEELTAMTETQLRKARQNIGMIFAFPLEIQGLGKDEIKKRVEPLLELVQLQDRADHYPSQLSGGQKQRVGIARALASNPKVLLCDEATSALDPQTTKSVVKEICDRVAVIENGSIIEEGNMVDVFTNPQNQTTKEFVKSVDKNTLPESLKSTPVSREYFEGASLAVRLSFFSGNADKPIVSGMIKRFGVDANIISGNTDQLKDRIYGTLLIVIEGPQKALEDSLDYLNSQNLQVEVIGYVK